MEEQNLLQESEYKSFPFFRILYRNLVLIICIIIAGGVIGAAYGIIRVKPVYTARCDIMINAKMSETETVSSGTSFTKKYMPTLADAMKTPVVESIARSESKDNGISRGAVGVSYNTDSLILSISYSDSSAGNAEKRLESFIKAADQVFQTTPPIPAKSIEVVELQNGYSTSSSNATSNYVIIGLVAGAVLGVVVAVLRYLLDNKMKDKDELEEITGASLLSYIEKQ